MVRKLVSVMNDLHVVKQTKVKLFFILLRGKAC